MDVFIYGAGFYASQLFAYFQLCGWENHVEAFLVSKKEPQQSQYMGKPIYEYDGFSSRKAPITVFIAIKDAKELEIQLKKDGIENVFLVTEKMIKKIQIEIFQQMQKRPICRKKIFFDCFHGKGYGCNSKYIAEYFRKHIPDIMLVWNICKIERSEVPSGVKVVERYSLEYYQELYTSGVAVFNDSFDIQAYKRSEQYYIETWHGSGSYKKICASIDEHDLELKANLKRMFDQIDLCVSGTQGNILMFRESLCYDGEVCKYGSPRVDVIFKNIGVREKICEQLEIPQNKKILLYAPTFRDDKDETFAQYDLQMNLVLKELQERFGEEFVLLYRFHHLLYQYDRGRNFYPFGINITEYPDVMEFVVAADVLITDYSSIMWDFGLQRRPIFLYQNDIEQYNDDRGFYKPISTWPYPIAHTQQELLDNIKNFDEQDYLKKLEAFIAADPSYDDGHASERVAARIMDVIENPAKYGKE